MGEIDIATKTLQETINSNVNSRQASWGAVPETKTNIDNVAARLTEARAANLDNGIVDWSDKTFQTSSLTGEHYTNTHLNITGSGYLVAFLGSRNGFSIQIDGGQIYRFFLNSEAGPVSLFPIRFSQSLLVKCDEVAAAATNVWVVLD